MRAEGGVKHMQNMFFAFSSHIALVSVFHGPDGIGRVWTTLLGVGERVGSHPLHCSGAPVVIGPVDAHFGGLWVLLKGGGVCFLSNGGG
jgi:hypothetical protein